MAAPRALTPRALAPEVGPGVHPGQEISSGGATPGKAWMIAALTMSVFTVIGITTYLLLRSPAPTGTTGGASPQQAERAPEAAPASTAGAGRSLPRGEAEAREALQRLAAGVRACTRDVLGILPGTSPAVPASFQLMEGGAYTSVPEDYRSPVYSCTGFRHDVPQPFQIQWQVFKGGNDGMAIAWLDTDGDGKAERALGLRVKLIKRGEVEVADAVEVLEPLPAVANLH
jgi:hypothetical protein